MKKDLFLKILLITIPVLLIIVSVIWYLTEKSISYAEPHEALFAIERDLLLIPAYKINNEALFFFIKDQDQLGASFVKEGPLGWKADMLTWSPMARNINGQKLDGYQAHGEKLIYGLIKDVDDRIIKIGENQAKILNLEILPPNTVEEYQVEDLYIWYFQTENALADGEIKLINKSNGEVIDTLMYR
jgi:hypothetical protein